MCWHPMEDVRFEIPLKEETLLFPEDGMKVPSGACFFLPFRLDLDGVMLQGATVQLICHKEDTWFFFAVDGIEGCYYLETGGMDRVEAAGCRRENVGGRLKLTPAACGTDSVITVVKKDGKKIRLVTLTRNRRNISTILTVRSVWPAGRCLIRMKDRPFTVWATPT